MAADGMVLTNHDHQTRVGILTGRFAVPTRSAPVRFGPELFYDGCHDPGYEPCGAARLAAS